MKAFVIDPSECSIEEVETPAELKDIHELIGCDCFDSAYPFGRREVIFVGDESALQEPPLLHFLVDGYRWPLYGRAVVLGVGAGGESRSSALSAEELSQRITFP